MKFLTFQLWKFIKKTDHQNNVKSFLSDRGDQSIKSQELVGHNYSHTLNKIGKTKKGCKSAPPPPLGLIGLMTCFIQQ